MKRLLIASLSLVAFDTSAKCILDAPEIGDIGPSSELVCRELDRRYPGATTGVEDRTILSPKTVAVQVSVDGEPMVLGYELAGFSWKLATFGGGFAGVSP